MIPRPPDGVFDTKIFQKLANAKEDRDGLAAKTRRFIELSAPLLDVILSGPFKNYTLHNRNHAKKLVHIAEYIIDPDTLQSLSKFECLLLICSCYLHDMGMAISQEELDSILRTQDYKDSVRAWPELYKSLEDRRESLKSPDCRDRAQIELEIADLHCVSLSNYLRPLHADKTKYKALSKLIAEVNNGNDIFEIRNVSFEDELIDICVSHNLDATHGTRSKGCWFRPDGRCSPKTR